MGGAEVAGSFLAGAVTGGVAGYVASRKPRILQLCKNLEAGKTSIDDFIKAVYGAIGVTPALSSLAYWKGRWLDSTDSELESNLFGGSNVPIVGLNGQDSTRARTLASLIVRAQISKSAT